VAYTAEVIATRPFHTLDDYVQVEEDSAIRHELVGGVIMAMAGGTVEHGRLSGNTITQLNIALRGTGCVVLSSDVRVGHAQGDFRAYPDATVLCGAPTYANKPAHTLTNPRFLVEVLSEGTAAYDRGAKLEGYQAIPSVEAVIFVSQEARAITVVRRAGERFETSQHGAGERFLLPGVAAALTVDSIYD